MKKRMENKIALTFMILFVVAFIINGLYSVISMNASFWTSSVLVTALFWALYYLALIWMQTRRHKLLAILGVLGIYFLIGSIITSSSNNIWTWLDTVFLVYGIIIVLLSSIQAEKLLKEQKKAEPINIHVNVNGENLTPKDIEVVSKTTITEINSAFNELDERVNINITINGHDITPGD